MGYELGAIESTAIEPPVLVLSDLHMGHPASYLTDPAMILPLLDTARTVVFNGDTAELLNLRLKETGRRLADQLIELCLQHRIRPIFLTGNHDPAASPAHHLDLFDGKVFLTHGDVLHPWVAPWSAISTEIWKERQRLLAGNSEPDSLEERLLLTKRSVLVTETEVLGHKAGLVGRIELLNKFASRPWRILITLHYWASVVHRCRDLLERYRPTARLMLIGHTHRPGVWANRDFTLINTGSFQPMSRPLMALLDRDAVHVHKVDHRRGCYHPGERLTRASVQLSE